jgi:hypothetical protein
VQRPGGHAFAQLAVPSPLKKADLHPYRLKVKELQNILLMAQARSRSRFVNDLADVEDAIGAWHDWDELVGIASKLLDHDKHCLLLEDLKRIAEIKYDHALSKALRLRKTCLQSPIPKERTLRVTSRARRCGRRWPDWQDKIAG